MNDDTLKKILKNKLIDRGMFIFAGGSVAIPPSRMFKTLKEEVLWILKESESKLEVKDIANYLQQDHQTIKDILDEFTSTSKSFIKKRKEYYTANISYSMDIPTAYKLLKNIIKQETKLLKKKRKMSEFTITSMNKCLCNIGLEFKPARVNGVIPIKIQGKQTVIAAIHPITRRFWKKDPSRNGTNGNYQSTTSGIRSLNELKLSCLEAIHLNGFMLENNEIRSSNAKKSTYN